MPGQFEVSTHFVTPGQNSSQEAPSSLTFSVNLSGRCRSRPLLGFWGSFFLKHTTRCACSHFPCVMCFSSSGFHHNTHDSPVSHTCAICSCLCLLSCNILFLLLSLVHFFWTTRRKNKIRTRVSTEFRSFLEA